MIRKVTAPPQSNSKGGFLGDGEDINTERRLCGKSPPGFLQTAAFVLCVPLMLDNIVSEIRCQGMCSIFCYSILKNTYDVLMIGRGSLRAQFNAELCRTNPH